LKTYEIILKPLSGFGTPLRAIPFSAISAGRQLMIRDCSVVQLTNYFPIMRRIPFLWSLRLLSDFSRIRPCSVILKDPICLLLISLKWRVKQEGDHGAEERIEGEEVDGTW